MTTLTCIICSAPMESHEAILYLHTGAVVHVPCRRSSSDAVGRSIALVRPSTQAVRLRARALRPDTRAKLGSARQVDNDVARFPAALLRSWKKKTG
jgi:hypothetical protein